MNGDFTKNKFVGHQQFLHHSISWDTLTLVVNGNYFTLNIGFPLKIGIFSSFKVIVVPVRIDFKLLKKPAETELTMVLLNKLVNGYSISFAKNAAAFFKKAISFSFSASSWRNLLFSS